jgi:short-subunit dehydrogenase
MGLWLRTHFSRRPWWMNGLMIASAYLAFIFLPWDFFIKPMAHDEEVWFGIMLHGWAAKATEPIHWAIYLAATYGFWHMRPWMWPWAALYMAQLAFAILVWNIVYVGGFGGAVAGVISFVPCVLLTGALWHAKDLFGRKGTSLRDRYGEWALITGASAGIGTEFARALARDKMSCVLTARREDRLHALARDLETTFGVSTRVVAADLSDAGGPDSLIAAVADLEISVLIANAGYGAAGRFDKLDTGRLRRMVQLNCVAPVVLASHLVPAMLRRARGAVIFTGSVAGAQPVPFNGVYGATKAFDRSLGEAMWAELQGTGVDVLVLEPGPTETEFQDVAGETAHAGESPAAVVAVALHALGRQPSVISGWINWLQANATRVAPRSLVALIAGQVMRQWTPKEMR